MSFNASNKTGEVIPLDPVDFLQFAGIGGVAKGVSSIVKPVLDNIIKQGPLRGAGVKAIQQAEKELAPIQKSISQRIAEFFGKPATKIATGGAGGAVAASTIPKQVITIPTRSGLTTIDKAIIGTGIASIPVTTGILSLTPGGQQLTTTAGGIIQTGSDIGKTIATTFQNNPIILLALIGLGIVVILKK